jgi:hypothetical protein
MHHSPPSSPPISLTIPPCFAFSKRASVPKFRMSTYRRSRNRDQAEPLLICCGTALLSLVSFVSSLIRIPRKIAQEREELLRLADEEPHGSEKVKSSSRSSACLSWANDRTYR